MTRAARALSPKPRPLGDAAGDSQHVLDRAADLRADHIVARIGPEPVGAQPIGQHLRGGEIAAREGDRRWPSCRHIRRKGRARQNENRGLRENRCDRFAHQRQRFLFDALGADDQRRRRRQVAGKRRDGRAHMLCRCRQQQGVRRCGLCQIGGGADRRIKRDARQIQRVFMRIVYRRDDVGFIRPKGDVVPGPTRSKCERGAPGASTDDRDHVALGPDWP